MATEKLAYRTIEQDGQFELRLIEPHVVAETFVEGDFESVGSEGFRRLVEYIGGANRTQARISMTAPVVQEPASEEIAMTAPVAQEKVGDRYRITFLMPSKYTLETLPQPTDTRIRLRAEPMGCAPSRCAASPQSATRASGAAPATTTTSADCASGSNGAASSQSANPCGRATTRRSCPGSFAATRS
jgi:hypothetical protein